MKLSHALAATVTAGALALAPTAANAESKVHVDPSGDMVSFASKASSEVPSSAPEHADGDMTSIRVTHLARTVRVQVTYRALNRIGLAKFLTLRVLSDKGVREVELEAFKNAWAGQHTIVNGAGKPVRCGGLGHKIDYVNDRVLIVIPRACLGTPRWVRVAAIGGTMEDDSNYTLYLDDARSTNFGGETPIYGPKVRKG